MSGGRWSLLGARVAAGEKVQPVGSPSLEALEPRLLLNADSIAVDLLLPPDVSAGEYAIYAEASHEVATLRQGDSSAILAFLTSSDKEGPSVERNDSTPGGSDEDHSAAQFPGGAFQPVLVVAEAKAAIAAAPLGQGESAVLADAESTESAATRQDESACLVPEDRWDIVLASVTPSIDIRGPPESSCDAITPLSTTVYGEQGQSCALAQIEGPSTKKGTDAPELPGLGLVDPDISNWQGQIVYLDFDGEQNVVYSGPVTVGPFDVPAFQAPGELAGQEQAIITEILAQLEHAFAGSGMVFTAEGPPESQAYSTIYVGGDDSAFFEYGSFLGLAEQVDEGNGDRRDDAIVFADKIVRLGEPRNECCRAIAEVIAHEVGHLVGFAHRGTEARGTVLESVAAWERITGEEVPLVRILGESPDCAFSLNRYGPAYILGSGSRSTTGITYDSFGRATGYNLTGTGDGHPVETHVYEAVYNSFSQIAGFRETRYFPESGHTYEIYIANVSYDGFGLVQDGFFVTVQGDLSILTSVDSVAVAEGSTGTFQVKLSAQPSSDVTVSVSRASGDSDISVTGGASRTFTTSNWNTHQTVMLSAAEDADATDGIATIRCSASGLANKDVTATEQDNDPLLLVTNTDSVTVQEGLTGTFQVKLSAQPGSDVTVSVSRAGGDGDISVTGGASLTFTTVNWASYQQVTLSAEEDVDATNGTATIRSSASGIADKDVTATEQDNDELYFVTSPDSIAIPEGSTGTLQVKLSAQPDADVAVTATVAGDTDIHAGSGGLVFTTSDWDIYQSMTLSAMEDGDTASGTGWLQLRAPGIPDKDIPIVEEDNDPQSIVTSTDSVGVPEGAMGTFGVKLAAQPGSNAVVSVNRVSGDSDITVTSGASLTFTTANWASYQTVTLSAAEDVDATNGTATIRCSASGLGDKDVVAAEQDNDLLLIVTSADSVDVPEGSNSTFKVKLSAQPDADVVVIVSRAGGDNDITVIDGSNLTFTTSDWDSDKTVTLSAAEDPDTANGTAILRLSAPGLPDKDILIREQDQNNDPVLFPDANLKAAVEEALGVTDPTASEMAAMTTLIAEQRGIVDLTGLENAVDLTELRLGANQITDISPLSDLTGLSTLDLFGNQISEISVLSGLVSLSCLYLGGNRISDVSALSYLSSLSALDLGSNQIGDISVLSELTSLSSLSLYNNQIHDISALSGLTHLWHLFLSGNQISTISPLSGLAGLSTLYLDSNQISDISALSGMNSLSTLALANNQISDISILSGLISLSTLQLSNNRIGDISVLSGLTSLSFLDLSSNQISDISVLSGLVSLSDLQLGNNQISHVSALSGLAGLARLDLRNNQISDISVLSSLTGLSYLNLHSNQISSISPLSSLTALSTLELDGNLISDISVLSGLSGLSYLNVSANQISSISPLSNLANLSILYLSSNQITDISALSGLTRLSHLDVSSNQISDISSLLGLTALDYVDLTYNRLSREAYCTSIPQILAANPGITLLYDPPPILTDADAVTISENATAAFQVKLLGQPASDVTVTVARVSGDNDISVTSGSSLTFTASDWDTYQTVTLSAAEDADTANGMAIIRCSASGLANKDITATEQDNDASSFVLCDMNWDGFSSIIGDVPWFVRMVYFGDSAGYEQQFPGKDPVLPGDCNGDGILSIIGDVPGFVNRVYFGHVAMEQSAFETYFGHAAAISEDEAAQPGPTGGQSDISSTEGFPIEARGPPAGSCDALSALYATTYGAENQLGALAEVGGVSTENGTKAPDLAGLVLVDPDISNWQEQIIYLDFDGEENVVYNGPMAVGPFDVPAFQAPGELAGREQVIIDEILLSLRETFADSGVIFTTHQPELGTQYSTIYIGGDDSPFVQYASFLGLAEQIDAGNLERTDEGLVFPDEFTVSNPTIDGKVIILATTIAHETGHLLGYAHDDSEGRSVVEPGFAGVAQSQYSIADQTGTADVNETAPAVPPASAAPLNVVLISDAVAQARQIQAAAASDTIAIIYHSETMTTAGLVDTLASVSAAHNGALVGHLGIVAHGGPGEIDLGAHSDLTLATLPNQPAELEQLRLLLTDDARLDLYSCSVAAGAGGKTFVGELAATTGADVFASDNPVGTVAGADSVWEYRTSHSVAVKELFSIREWETIPDLSLFSVGQRIQAASGGTNVRNGALDTVLYTQYGGVHGIIIGQKQGTAGGFSGNWWEINWDSEPPNWSHVSGWSAESIIKAVPAGGDFAQPDFTTDYYTTANIFWQRGYAPSSTNPPNPKLGTASGNCTWYASGRMLELGYNASQVSALHGNAGDWASEAIAAGIPTDTTPTVGSIAQTTGGHVAVVESVNADGTITVTESSYWNDPSSVWDILWHNRTCSPTWFQNYIHVSKGSVTRLLAPTLSNPADGAADVSTTTGYSWSQVSGNHGYRIVVSTNSADLTTDPTQQGNLNPTDGFNVTTATNVDSCPGQMLSADTKYYWAVHALGGTLDEAGYWAQGSFTTQSAMSVNPSASDVASQVTSLAQQYSIPAAIIANVAYKESQWRQFDSDGSVLSGPTGDVGIMQINVLSPAVTMDTDRVRTDWRYNMEIGCRILQDKFSRSCVDTASPYDNEYDTQPTVIENWYYPIAWYNGSGSAAYDYVTSVWQALATPPPTVGAWCSGIPGLGNPQDLTGFPTTVYPSVPYPNGSLNLATATPSDLISHGMYTLLLLANDGERIHRWDASSGLVSDITDAIVPAGQTYTLTTGLNGLSFPFTPKAGGSSLFSDVLAPIQQQRLPYVFYMDDDGAFKFHDLSSDPGAAAVAKTGYLLYLKEPASLPASGDAFDPGITLHTGWNFVGVTAAVTPAPNDKVYQNAFVLESDLRLEPRAIFQDGMVPGVAYFVLSITDGNVLIPSATGASMALSSPSSEGRGGGVFADAPSTVGSNTIGDDFQAILTTSQEGTNDVTVRFGIRPGATDGYDSADQLALPSLPGFSATFFNDQHLPLSASYKTAGDVKEWSLVVRSQSAFPPSVPDNRNPVTLSWTIPFSGVDSNAQFQLLDADREVLVADMRTQTTYSFSVTAAGMQKDFIIRGTLAAQGNQPPTDIVLSPSSVAENQQIGTVVGSLSGTDPDAGQSETLTFSLVNGWADNAYFSIDSSTKQLKTAAVFDYETKSSYSIKVRATDTGDPPATYDEEFTVAITDVAEQSQSIVVSSDSLTVAEGGTAQFTVSLGVQPASPVTVTISKQLAGDADLSADRSSLTFTTGNWNETQPVVVAAAPDSDTINGTATFVVSSTGLTPRTVIVTEQDNDIPEDSWRFPTATGKNDNAWTSPANAYSSNGVYATAQGTSKSQDYQDFDFNVPANAIINGIEVAIEGHGETTGSDNIICEIYSASDGEWTRSGWIVLGDGSDLTVTHGSDSDLWGLTWQASDFSNTNFLLKVKTWSNPDKLYVDHIQARVHYTEALANNAPTDIMLSDTTIAENEPSGTVIGTLTTADPDVGDTWVYSIASGEGDSDNGLFMIDGSGLKTGLSFDYETKNAYSIRIRSTDQGGLYAERVFAIGTTDVNEAPTVVLANAMESVSEDVNTMERVKAADIVVMDDALGTNELSLSGVDQELFEIDGSVLYLKAGAALDHETNPQLDAVVEVDDSEVGPTPDDNASLSIAVTDVNEAPNVPSCVLPADAASGVSLTPTLGSSPFADPDVGDTHHATQWQVDDDSNFLTPLWDYEDTDADKTSQAVPAGILAHATTYHWRVRHQDNHGVWSEWSITSSFTTESASNFILGDMNWDGFVSIIGDVPWFVQVVYFGDYGGYEEQFPGKDPVLPGDCNGDGILSIIGDVPGFVDRVYFGLMAQEQSFLDEGLECACLDDSPLSMSDFTVGTLGPSDYEQYLLELVNRGRADPAAEAARCGIDLNEGLDPGTISTEPKPPLAFSPELIAAARGHSEWMLATDTFSHTGEEGSSPGDRMDAAGYTFVPPWEWGENIAWRGSSGMFDVFQFTADTHAGLFGSPVHRVNLMNESFREVGIGLAQGVFAPSGDPWNALIATEDFAYSGNAVFLTGVVYDDALVLADQSYTPGEGLGGVTIEAVRDSDGQVFLTATWASGGYSLALPSGTYSVAATGGALGGSILREDVSVSTQNVKLDFTAADFVVLGDMNWDGFVSIIGDVPWFAKMVYSGDYDGYGEQFPGKDPALPGDFNGDGVLSIVGDVPGFVNRAYLG